MLKKLRQAMKLDDDEQFFFIILMVVIGVTAFISGMLSTVV